MSLPTVHQVFDALNLEFKLSPRASQLTLAHSVCATLAKGGICCIEAPTGTGKTLGYLAGALEHQAHQAQPIPIVVATATVGLQEQIIRHDIPRLAAVGALDASKVAIAKGRGRYFCPRMTSLLKDRKSQDSQFDMFAPDKELAAEGAHIALEMLDAWEQKKWDGDRDSWGGSIPKCWDSACGANKDTCVNKSCEFYASCPYLASRAKLSQAMVIIANHDLVLSDLALRTEETAATVLPVKRYSLIFDEAHNLPEKALGLKRSVARLHALEGLRELEQYGERLQTMPALVRKLERSVEFSMDLFSFGAASLVEGLSSFSETLESACRFGIDGNFSWGLSTPPASLVAEALCLGEKALRIESALQKAAEAYAEMAENAIGVERSFVIRQLAETQKHSNRLNELSTGLLNFAEGESLVRWAFQRKDSGIELHSQPMEGKEVLTKLLWDSDIPVALVSATLQIAGSFERFRQKTGLPSHATTVALPPVFDYSRGFLHLPHMTASPLESGYEAEIVVKLQKLLAKSVAPGVLVLFTSKESMQRVAAKLPEHIAKDVLRQGTMPVPELVAQHRENIDAGRRSILMGLDSMAEGLDLPGRYCGHVVITRLPFGVPSDPVETARRDSLGFSKWFNEAYLADMLTMLIQSCGRLIRREDDHGVVTILDKRLTTKRYALTALKALPAFSRGNLVSGYFSLGQARGFNFFKLGEIKPAANATASGKLTLVPPAPRPSPLSAPAPSRSPESPDTPALPNPAAAAEPRSTCSPASPPKVASREERLRQKASGPFAVGAAFSCRPRSVWAALSKAHPPEPRQVSDIEDSALGDFNPPCLAPTTPASLWAERLTPQSLLQGILFLNTPWDDGEAPWKKTLRLRPDLLQFLEILRNYRQGLPDSRRKFVSAEACALKIEQCFAGAERPSDAQLIEFLGALEKEAVAVVSSPYKKPTKEFLLELSQAGLSLPES